MNGFRETASLTDGRTNERTNERDSLGLQRLRRETKNVTFLHYIRLALMQKIRQIQCAAFEKNAENL